MTNRILRIGILSFAHLHAEAYIGNLRANPNVNFIGIADTDAARAAHFARVFGAPLLPSPEALLREKPDAVVVCSENALHRELTEMAAQAGAHVLCEKPLAITPADARSMVEACKRAGVRLMTAFPMRFSPPLRETKAALDDAPEDRVMACNTANQGQLPAHLRAWFVDKAMAGGGAVADHIVHCADALRWMLHSEAVEVYAQANRIIHANDVSVETGGLAMLRFANGVVASIDCSWSRPMAYPTWGGMTMKFVREHSVLAVDAFKQYATTFADPSRAIAWNFWGSDVNQAMIDEFVNCILEDREPSVTGVDGLRAVEIVDAAYRSVESGQPEVVIN